jgi:pilus assembly protein CpaB
VFRRQSIIALGIALLLGLVAVYVANAYLISNRTAAEDDPNQMVRIAVAAVPLEYGAEVTPDKVRFAAYPKSSIPEGSFSQLETLLPPGKRRVVLRAMSVNEPILIPKISAEGQGASLAALLPDGMRATSVRINDVSGVAGFVTPNDSVDVLITRTMSGANGQQVTDLLLKNKKVLAIGQDAKGQDGQPVVAQTATLEVDPLEAQKLALAQQVGSLSLVLRKPGMEQDTGYTDTVSLQDLRIGRMGSARYNSAAVPTARVATVNRAVQPRRMVRPVARVRVPPRADTNNVQIVRGTANSNYEVGEYGS